MGLNPEFLLKFYLLSIILLVSHTKKLYCGPETQPVISMIYIETPKDLRRLEQAAQDGRFHVTWFLPYVFRDVSITGNPVSFCNSIVKLGCKQLFGHHKIAS